MIRKEGMHFYINIPNLDQVVIDEETKTGKVNHSLHALDTFFSMIESFGKKHFPQSFVVEKITGSRLHMYVTDSLNEAFEVVAEVSGFAYKLTSYLNHEIAKYKTCQRKNAKNWRVFHCLLMLEALQDSSKKMDLILKKCLRRLRKYCNLCMKL